MIREGKAGQKIRLPLRYANRHLVFDRPMSIITRVMCCAVVLAALVLTGTPALAQEPVVVRVTPATLTLTVGGESDVAVEVVGVEGLYGFDVQMTFDPAVVEVVDADPTKPGVQVSLGRLLDSGMSVRDGADNEAGTIHYAMTQINPSEAKSGTGNLIVIRLRGKTVGTTSLAFTSVDLARRDATAIATTLQPGALTVQAGTSTQPTHTPIPTQAPPTPIPTALPAAAQGSQPLPTATLPAPATPTTPAQPTPTATSPAPATPATEAQPTTAAQTSPTLPPTRAPGDTPGTDGAAVAATSATVDATAHPVVLQSAAAAAAAIAAGSTPVPDKPTLAPAEPTATPQAMAVAPSDDQSGSQPERAGRTQDERAAPERTLLIVGAAALLLAGLLGVVLLLVGRRRTPAP